MRTLRLTVAALLVAGCGATTPIPVDKLTRAQQRVREAGALDAAVTDPKALAHLRLAKEQLTYGKRLLMEGENKDARWVLMRAEADAEAALALANVQAAEADARQTIEAIRQAMALLQQGGSGS